LNSKNLTMSEIRIKNFGPIKEGYLENNGWMDINKVTLFTGNQGSGKSTVTKTISILSWLEKSINRGDTKKEKISFAEFKEFFSYQKIQNYFSKDTFIGYKGERYNILYNPDYEYPDINEVNEGKYLVPKIMYIPAERNFFGAISNAFELQGLPGNLFDFAVELKTAQKQLNGKKLRLPLKKYSYGYDENTDTSYILGKEHQINLLEASSGFQSLVPLFLVSRHLSNSIFKDEESQRKNLSVTQSIRMNKEISDIMLNNKIELLNKNDEIDKIRTRYYNKCFLNIVEEPELNLYPSSQWEILKSLLEYNNLDEGNKLLMTTHSPFLINYLTIAVKANSLKGIIEAEDLKDKLNKIVPLDSTINQNDLTIYELDEIDGTIKKLQTYNGLPSDENQLNERLGESNELFAQLLEIQQKL